MVESLWASVLITVVILTVFLIIQFCYSIAVGRDIRDKLDMLDKLDAKKRATEEESDREEGSND